MESQSETYQDSIEVFLDMMENTRYEDLPAEAVKSAKIFLLDTLGVALAGHLAPKLMELSDLADSWDSNPARGVSVWNLSLIHI